MAGGGGAGAAGGGGGGRSGGADRIDFLTVKSDPTAIAVTPPTQVVKVPPPAIVTPPPAPAPAPVTQPQPDSVAASTGAAGSGTDAGGAGPGSGGGVGSGIGPGRGSGVGPGTGGGPAKDYPPTPREVFLPPLPQPPSVRGQHLRAWFDVDERGNSRLISFEHTRDGGYNKLLEQTLRETRFRPGVRADGTAVRDTAMIEIIF